MAAENIYDLIVEEKPKLAARLNENEDVSAFLMAMYSHLLYMAIESPNDPKHMVCLVDICRERLLRIDAQYYKKDPVSVHMDKRPINRNLNLVKFLQVNRSVRDVAQRVVEVLERWVDEHQATKAQGFRNIKIMNGMKTGDTITGELVVTFEFHELVNAKMKWDMDFEESAEKEKGLVTP